ncbi:MAG: hypothetical protein HKN19_12150 [Halioglobus sp.]|nr:hypothetical protein [Halioglobus sp.]
MLLAAVALAATATPDLAPIMPLASRSLLLDITQAGERLVVAGERGHILYSDDNGAQWRQAAVPTTQMLTGVYFVDDRRGWAAGHDGLVLASEDGGATWRIQRDGLAAQHQRNLELREEALDSIQSLQSALDNATDDQREDLQIALEDARFDLEDADIALSEPVFTSPLMGIWFQDANHGWAIGAFGTLITTRDGGRHWTDAAGALENPDEFHLNTITGDGKGRVFIAGEGGVMFRSLDRGESWQALPTIYEGSWFGAVYHARSDALLVFGLRGHLYRSTDFGATWSPVEHDSQVSLAGGTASTTGDIVLGGAVGTYLTSYDGGLNFTRKALRDRLSLASGLHLNERLILIGQGGVKVLPEGR